MTNNAELNQTREGDLRRAAESRLTSSLDEHSAQAIVHELRVHEIELEMQNEALRSTQLALEDTRDRYHDLFEFAPVGYLTLNRTGIIDHINLAAVRLLGVERAQALGRRLVAFVADDDRDPCHIYLRKLSTTPSEHGSDACELSLQQPGGARFPARLHGLAIPSADGEFTLRIALTDLSESRQLAALNESETRLRLAIEAIPGGLYDWNRRTGALYWNSSFNDNCKFRERGFSPQRCWWRERVHRQDLQRIRSVLIEAIRGRRQQFSVEYRIQCNDGQWCDVLDRAQIVRDANGHVARFVGTLTDISAYKESAQRQAKINDVLENLVRRRTAEIDSRTRAFLESERFSRETMDSIDIRLCVLDERGAIIARNKAWRDFEAREGGCESCTVRRHPLPRYGMGCWSLVAKHQVDQAVADLLARRREAFALEYECTSRSAPRWFEMYITRFEGEGPTRLVIRHKECTARKLAEIEQRRSAERIKQLVRHADSVSEAKNAAIARELHDELGASLTMLKLGLATLAGQERDHRARETFSALIEQANNALKVTRRISGSLRPPTLDTLGLVTAVRAHMEQFSLTTGIASTLLPARERIELSDAANIAVFRIVQEALTNVAKHADARHVLVNARKYRETLIVRIVDDGCGIRDGAMQRNDAFGIIGMRERIQHLGGALSIGRTPFGSGTRLTLRVPIDGQQGTRKRRKHAL